MKKSFLFVMAVAATLMTSCSSDEESTNVVDSNAPVEIKLSSVASMSRASLESNANGAFTANGLSIFALASKLQAGGAVTSWAADDEYACILNNKSFNAVPNADKTGSDLIPVGTTYYYPLSDLYTYRFYGAYPAVDAANLTATATQYSAKYTIDGTQDIIWGQSDNDVYCGKYYKTNPTAAAPNIAFKHLLTRLTFSCEPSADYAARLKNDPSVTLYVKSISVNNVPTVGNLIIADNANAANAGKIEFDAATTENLFLKAANDAALSPVALAVKSDGTADKVKVGSSIMLPSDKQFAITIVLANKNGEELVKSSKVITLSDATASFLPGKSYNVNLQVKSANDIEITITATLNPWEDGEDINVEI